MLHRALSHQSVKLEIIAKEEVGIIKQIADLTCNPDLLLLSLSDGYNIYSLSFNSEYALLNIEGDNLEKKCNNLTFSIPAGLLNVHPGYHTSLELCNYPLILVSTNPNTKVTNISFNVSGLIYNGFSPKFSKEDIAFLLGLYSIWTYNSFKFVILDMKEKQRGTIYSPNKIFLKSILPMSLLQQEIK